MANSVAEHVQRTRIAPVADTLTHGRNIPLGYLRAFVTLLVVAHHAFLAYHPFAPPQAQTLKGGGWWAAFPIVDSRRWAGIEAFVGFNDVFFMSLMFLISGIFVPFSLSRKGAASFLRDRLIKLGVPFAIGAAFLAPLAYYPTYLAGAREGSFWSQWLSIGFWPAGPVWFLWVLIAFAAIAAAIHRFNPRWTSLIGALTGRFGSRPILYFACLLAVSAVAYIPMAVAFTAERWFTGGPFSVQSSRIFHYFVYFVAGIGLGAYGVNKGLLAPDGKLARRWYLWLVAALAAFALVIVSVVAVVATLPKGGPALSLLVFAASSFVLSCACSSLALVALFLRFARRANGVMNSLSTNAYGIYLFHYFCVTWLQFGILGMDLPASAKALLVVALAVLASWAITAGLRRIPAVRSIL